MNQPQPDRQFFTLLWSVCDGTADEQQLAALEQQLLESEAARQLYLKFIALHNDLASEGAAGKWLDAQSLLTELNDTEAIVALPQATNLSQGRARTRSFAWLAAAVVLAIASWSVLAQWVFPKLRRANESVQLAAQPTLGHLTATLDCRWSGGHVPGKPGDEVSAGEFQLQQGVAELRLINGVQLRIEGPATLQLQQVGRSYLQHGRLVASVPPQAIGYTVTTPTVEIVDLGTEFGVEADSQGETTVEVLEGKVQVSYEASSLAVNQSAEPSRRTLRLHAGEAKQLRRKGASDGITVVDVTSVANSKRRVLANRNLASVAKFGGQRLTVEGVIASSEYRPGRATHLIDGSGLNGERHTAQLPEDTMWWSALGDTKNVLLSFDLGRVRRLHSMKVWNYNDGDSQLHLSRGVKRADVYVSTTGKWDPFKEPTAWKKVMSAVELKPGTGTDDYDTPNVLPLNNVEARFVAVVVLDRLGPDPRGVPDDKECIALSEVQFIGEWIPNDSIPKTKSP